MQITGTFPIPAPRQRVWDGLNDPEVLRQCIPGCESLTRLSDTEMEGKVVAKVGPVKATFTGRVTLSDLDPPNGYTISGEGKGGVAGFAKGVAKVTLSDDGAGTVLSYAADASVGGKLAQVGARLIEAAAGQMAQDFFGRFAALVAAEAAAAPAEATTGAAGPSAPVAAAPQGAPGPSAAAPARRSPVWWWVGGLVVIAVIVIWLLAK